MCSVWPDSYARDDYHDRIQYPDNTAATGRNASILLLADHYDHHHVVA
jgi:hypothetical protein